MIDIEDVSRCDIGIGLISTRDIYLLHQDGRYMLLARFDANIQPHILSALRSCIVTGAPNYSEHSGNFVKRSRNVWVHGKPLFALANGFKAKRNVQLALCRKLFNKIARGDLKEC